MLMHRWVQLADGARLYYADEGSGTPVVMLHGLMANHTAVRGMMRDLQNHSRLITPDIRANGHSVYHGDLTFDLLVDDLEAVMDDAGIRRAIIGGVSGGAAIALRFALRHATRTVALVQVTPCYAGSDTGLTAGQRSAFHEQKVLVERALAEGVEVLRPLYERLPPAVGERAKALLESADLPSMAATSRFLSEGGEPFAGREELRTIAVPTLLIPGTDQMHPPAVSELYARHIYSCEVAKQGADVANAVRQFVLRVAG